MALEPGFGAALEGEFKRAFHHGQGQCFVSGDHDTVKLGRNVNLQSNA